MISCSSHVFFIGLSAKLQSLNKTMGPIWSATGNAGSAPKKGRKVMTSQENTELCDMFYRMRSAATHHLRINESSIKDHNEKKNNKFMKLSLQLGVGDQPLFFLLLLLSLLSAKTTMKTFVMIHFHLTNSNHYAIITQSSKEQQGEILESLPQWSMQRKRGKQ